MYSLSLEKALWLWERGSHRSPVERSILLLRAACPNVDEEALLSLPLGVRDQLFIRLYQTSFGTRVDAVETCSSCGEKVDVEVPLDSLGAQMSKPVFEPSLESLKVDCFTLRYRLPATRDMLQLIRRDHASDPSRSLLLGCVSEAKKAEHTVDVSELPEATLEALESAMREADPMAEISFELRCPDCGHQWTTVFDILSFFWIRLEAFAKRGMREVATLAQRFGWNEAEILSMSATRRQAYLQLATT